MSFRLLEAETRYTTTEKEALVVLRCFEEVRWLVVRAAYDVMLYTDYTVLLSVLKGDTPTYRLTRWQYRLGDYDFVVHYVPGKKMYVADGLSRLLGSGHYGESNEIFDLQVLAVETQRIAYAEEVLTNDMVKQLDQYDNWATDDWYGHITYYLITGEIPNDSECGDYSRAYKRRIRH
jgi:hypothetical protein